jgi:hypothetical protein
MLGAHRFWEALAGQRHLPGVRGEGAVEDFAVLKGDELSRRDKQNPRPPFVERVEPDDLIDVGEWEGVQQCRIHDAEQPGGSGNPGSEGQDSRCGEAGPAAEDAQRISEIYGEDVQQAVSSVTSAKERYHSRVISHTAKSPGASRRPARARAGVLACFQA